MVTMTEENHSYEVDFTLNITPNFTLLSEKTPQVASLTAIVLLTLLFSVIVVVGLVGNCLTIALVLRNSKMRQCVTNVLIVNVAVSDVIIMSFGVPEIVMFFLNKGWLLQAVACKVNRFFLVVALYSSVISLVVICSERFCGILFPFKVYDVFIKRNLLPIVTLIWFISGLCGLPVLLFNTVIPTLNGYDTCQIVFPGTHSNRTFFIYKCLESILFYFLPLMTQVTMYSMISRRLFSSSKKLWDSESASKLKKWSLRETIKTRRSVVKMLVASVGLYFLSYSPIQFQFFYQTFTSENSKDIRSWEFFVFAMILTHINSAANPILYGIFSERYKVKYQSYLCRCGCNQHTKQLISTSTKSTRTEETEIKS
uniref:G-protein coupled receptors family 1 profile domain-containing protein n=1 Tax=Biomphalaria glabrata TaxID=6526 RepID=A0A2C9JXQ3_BIOGL